MLPQRESAYALFERTSARLFQRRWYFPGEVGGSPEKEWGAEGPPWRQTSGKGIGLDGVELDVPGVFATRLYAHELEVQACRQRRGLFGVGPNGEPATTKADDLQPGVVWSVGGRGILRVELDLHHAIVQPSAERLAEPIEVQRGRLGFGGHRDSLLLCLAVRSQVNGFLFRIQEVSGRGFRGRST